MGDLEIDLSNTPSCLMALINCNTRLNSTLVSEIQKDFLEGITRLTHYR